MSKSVLLLASRLASLLQVAELKSALHDLLRSGKVDQHSDESVSRPNLWIGKGLLPSRQRIMFK